jgi:hypothetical protein
MEAQCLEEPCPARVGHFDGCCHCRRVVGRRRRALLYSCVAAGILLWAAAIVYVAAAVLPADPYLISYYAADYTFGFVRRGLAGAIVGTVSGESFFDNARAMRWLLTALYLFSLAALVLVLMRGCRSERKTMLALLIPVLPFGVPYAVYSARPDLLGAAALVGLSLSLTFVRGPRSAAGCCGLYGLLIAVMAFMHEGIALEFGLGAILAILLLPRDLTPPSQRLCAALALCPGLLSALIVAVFARHDVSERLCSRVPHELLENPLAAVSSFPQLKEYIFSGHQTTTDYHDWVCSWYLRTYDYSIADGVKEVAAVGAPGLLSSFLLGMIVIAVSLGGVRYISGVPFEEFVSRLRPRLAWPSFGLALMIPVFATGFDCTRWLLIIAFNIVIVYVLYARSRSEMNEAPTPRAVRMFVLAVLAFALIPLGLVPGGPVG